MTNEEIQGLSPEVRDLVVWLNEQGFETTDSGDGSNFKAGMEGALSFPHVFMKAEPKILVHEGRRLYRLLEHRGIDFKPHLIDPQFPYYPQIQATYDPHDETGVLLLMHVRSEDGDFPTWKP